MSNNLKNKDKFFNAEEVIKRLKYKLNYQTEIDMAKELDIASSTISSWKNRNSIDIGLIVEKLRDRIDYNYLLLGESYVTSEPQAKYEPSEIEKTILRYEIKTEILEDMLKQYVEKK